MDHRRRFAFVALVFALAVAALGAPTPARAQDDAGFQPWGTWVWWTHSPAGFALPTIVTLHREGTANTSSSNLFGGVPNARYWVSPLHDSWRRTEGNEIETTCMSLVFDAQTHLLVGWGRIRNALRFGADADHLEGTMYVDFLACPSPVACPDPQDPAAVWTVFGNSPPSGFPITATRLQIVPPGPLP